MAIGALDLDGDSAVKDGRGWAMRRGHCKRLRGDQGRESQRGRAAFARSVNRSSKGHNKSARIALGTLALGRRRDRRAPDGGMLLRSVADEQLTTEDCLPWFEWATEADVSASCANSLCEGHGDEGGDSSTASVCSADAAGSATTSDWELVEPPRPRLERSASAPVTAREVGAAEASRRRALVPLRAWSPVALASARVAQPRPHGCARCQRWLLAVELAEHAATMAGARESPATPLRQHRLRQKDTRARTPSTPFDRLRQEFLKEHGESLRSRLGTCLGLDPQNVKLANAPVCEDPVTRFMGAKARLKDCRMLPVYHGTDPKNFQSIFSRGLLIPGKANGLRVENGSAHGLGIYTAVLDNPWLSHSYCRGGGVLLVCACLEGGKNSDAHLKRVGGALVIFDPDRVIPMLVAHDPYRTTDPLARRAVHVPTNYAPRGAPPEPPERAGAARAALRLARAAARRAAATAAAPGLPAHYARRAAQRRRT